MFHSVDMNYFGICFFKASRSSFLFVQFFSFKKPLVLHLISSDTGCQCPSQHPKSALAKTSLVENPKISRILV
jgi:hypothetical protein